VDDAGNSRRRGGDLHTTFMAPAQTGGNAHVGEARMRNSLSNAKRASRVLLCVFSFFVCSALIASYAFSTVHARSTAVSTARRTAENLALSLSDQASDTFEAVNEVLVTVTQRIQAVGLGSATRAQLRDDFAELVTTMPRIHRLDVLDAHGRFVVSNISATPNWLPPLADRPYFRYHRRHADPSMHISGPGRSRTERQWVIFATRRLNRPDGSFAGVLIAPIPFDHFAQIYSHVDIGRRGAITLLADDGTIMMREPQASIGRSLGAAALFHDPYRYLAAGSYFSGSDRATELVAFHRLAKYPLVVSVALAESEYLHDWFVDAVKNAITLCVYVVFALLLTVFLNVQLGRTSRAEAELARLALVDGLTGLSNRREFDVVLDREWRRAVRDGRPLALLMIDVDHFKAYNDAYGHQQGDAVLSAIASAIATTVKRATDTAARYGGEEFAVILHDTDSNAATALAESVRRAVADLGITHAGNGPGIATISIGTASVIPARANENSPSCLIGAADAALYLAKRAGRNQVSGTQSPPVRN
jgi:diguanylate cyclase (GGDEF)-like protein